MPTSPVSAPMRFCVPRACARARTHVHTHAHTHTHTHTHTHRSSASSTSSSATPASDRCGSASCVRSHGAHGPSHAPASDGRDHGPRAAAGRSRPPPASRRHPQGRASELRRAAPGDVSGIVLQAVARPLNKSVKCLINGLIRPLNH